MLHRFIKTALVSARQKATRPAAWVVVVRDTVSGFMTTAHHTLMILGISAIAAWGVLFAKPEIAGHLKVLLPFADANAEVAPAGTPSLTASSDTASKVMASTNPQPIPKPVTEDGKAVVPPRQQQWVTNWLSKRYHVATDATNMLVSAAYLTAKEIKLDPLLILAVMAIESGFNPFAESPVGAQGLMQVMSKVHHDKFQELGGIKAALNPVANIKVGSLILKDYVTRGGSIEAGLKLYVGAAAFDSDSGYGARVLAEYRRLKDVSAGKKVPVSSSSASSVSLKTQRSGRKADESEDAESASADPAKWSSTQSDQLASL